MKIDPISSMSESSAIYSMSSISRTRSVEALEKIRLSARQAQIQLLTEKEKRSIRKSVLNASIVGLFLKGTESDKNGENENQAIEFGKIKFVAFGNISNEKWHELSELTARIDKIGFTEAESKSYWVTAGRIDSLIQELKDQLRIELSENSNYKIAGLIDCYV